MVEYTKVDNEDVGKVLREIQASDVSDVAETITGVKTFASMPRFKVNAPVAGLGTVQADAAQLAEGITVITGADGALGWKLPAAVAGATVILKGTTAGVAKIWPATGDAINAIAANGVFDLPTGVIPVILVAIDATTWYSIPLVPS